MTGHMIPDEISTNRGLLQGLQMELFVGQPKSLNSFGYESGVHLLINNKSAHFSFFEGLIF
jgi:hypothetical protein